LIAQATQPQTYLVQTVIIVSLLDTIAPSRGSGRNRFGPVFFAKTAFFVSVVVAGIFGVTSFVLFDGDRELPVIPATRIESEILNTVKEFLISSDVESLDDRSVIVNCWREFEDIEFNVEYLEQGSWRVDAFYNLVRYYWRVDDLTLELTQGKSNRTTNPTIRC
jgi:hypothetical protein